MSRACLYYRREPERDRWLPGDRFVRPLVRRVLRGPPRPGGIDRVFLNLCKGLARLRIPFEVNLPFAQLRPDDRVAVLGRGRAALAGYDRPNPIVAGIGLMTHPAEWPSLCDDYPVVTYLQHSEWTRALYVPYFGDRCALWPAGIDCDHWHPTGDRSKAIDLLIYDKISWDRPRWERELLEPIRSTLSARGLRMHTLRYGTYAPEDYRALLRASSGLLFLSPHESQGIAYQEAMASGVPVLAWDPGTWMDPNRFAWGVPEAPATSVPFFDERCGERFTTAADFPAALDGFMDNARGRRYRPREYVLERLTLEHSAHEFLAHLDAATSGDHCSARTRVATTA